MQVLFDEVDLSQHGCWLTLAPPHQIAKLSEPLMARGTTSVLLASSPVFQGDQRQLRVDADHIVVLNLGTTPRTFVIDTSATSEAADTQEVGQDLEVRFGPGDTEFLHLVERELLGEAQEVGVDL